MDLDNLLQSFRTPYHLRISPGLERIRALLEHLGNPQDDFLSVHVAGTNGKGSVCAMLHSVFIETESKTALFTSPHLERFTERIKINNQEIKEDVFLNILAEKVFPAIDKLDASKFGRPTEFEVITAAAFCYFSAEKVEIAVIEAGLGGRLDATNILKNVLVSVITNISIDHSDRLGLTIEEITREKGGIIKEGVPIVTTARNQYLNIFREKTCLLFLSDPEEVKETAALIPGHDNYATYPNYGYQVIYNSPGSIFDNTAFTFPFYGRFQFENLSLVLKVLSVVYSQRDRFPKIKENGELFTALCRVGISKARWPGRFEFVNYKNLKLLFDGAHNPGGMKVFTETLKEIKNSKFVITIFGCNKDKELNQMLDLLIPFTDYFIATKSHVDIKAKPPEDISTYLSSKGILTDEKILADNAILNNNCETDFGVTETNIPPYFEEPIKVHKIITDYRQTINFASKIISDRSLDYKNTLVVVCGSLYLVGALRAMINAESK